MPFYSFRCTDCADEFDLLRPMAQSDDPAACMRCGGETKKLVTAPAIRIAKTDFVDHSTGIRFKTEEDCTIYCRQNNLSDNEPGRFSAEAAIREQADAEARDEAEFTAYTDKLQNDPDFAEVRRLSDAGFFRDRALARAAEKGHNPASIDHNLIATATP